MLSPLIKIRTFINVSYRETPAWDVRIPRINDLVLVYSGHCHQTKRETAVCGWIVQINRHGKQPSRRYVARAVHISSVLDRRVGDLYRVLNTAEILRSDISPFARMVRCSIASSLDITRYQVEDDE
mgnify:CR=1 FL=1